MELSLQQGVAVLHGKPLPLAEQCATLPGCVRLLERVSTRINSVDRDAGVLKDVKVLGYQSANNRTYSREAVKKARGMYEGRPVNINHGQRGAAGDRAVADRFGQLRNVRLTDDGLIGDLHYLKSHAMAPVVVEAAERMPDCFGLSHNAEGRVRHVSGKNVVDEISRVHSVDLVSDPATTKSLFEMKLADDELPRGKMTAKDFKFYGTADHGNRDATKRLDKDQLVNGIMRDEHPPKENHKLNFDDQDPPQNAGKESDKAQEIRAAFGRSIASAAVDPLLTPQQRKQSVTALMAAMDEALATLGQAPRTLTPDGKAKPVEESRRRWPISTENLAEVAGFLRRRSR